MPPRMYLKARLPRQRSDPGVHTIVPCRMRQMCSGSQAAILIGPQRLCAARRGTRQRRRPFALESLLEQFVKSSLLRPFLLTDSF